MLFDGIRNKYPDLLFWELLEKRNRILNRLAGNFCLTDVSKEMFDFHKNRS